MTWPSADQIHRTAKVLIDSGLAMTPDEARRHLESLMLQVAVGAELGTDPAAQAALATIVNAGRRAFLGGVEVVLDDDAVLSVGTTASALVRRHGGRIVDTLRVQEQLSPSSSVVQQWSRSTHCIERGGAMARSLAP
jgi:hypothetical protein